MSIATLNKQMVSWPVAKQAIPLGDDTRRRAEPAGASGIRAGAAGGAGKGPQQRWRWGQAS